MTTMTDEQREERIRFCGKQIEICMAVGDREKADHWRQDMEHAIAQRTPEQISKMEIERGLEVCETFDHLAERDLSAFLKGQAA